MDGSTSFLPQLGLMQPARWVTSKELHLFLFMVNETVPVCDIHYSSAIHSNRVMDVTNWHGLYLLEDMLSKGLQPSVVTFANVAGAHRQALLDELEGILSSMADNGVIPNKVFIETFLGALFPARLTAAWTVDDVRIRLKGTSRHRLRVAKSVLKDAESRGVRLAQLSSLTEQYLQQLNI
ncbi:Kidins220 [Symbiodinium necroappetens]|uniref:Kidins220 protein n=1 Tax=Symbiodinium necroappetens TaxID=1628268 RepID=A0A813ABN3_9DINO|nr:Kidins220 [Symbiodinium necroappetens]